MRARPPFVPAALVLASLVSLGQAAPLPAPRAPLGGPFAPDPARLSSAVPARDAGVAPMRCAAAVDALPEAVADWIAREALEPLPTPNTRDHQGIAVLEDDGTFFYTNSGGQPHVDIASVARAYARTHEDVPDQLAIYLASGLDHWLGSPGALAACWVLRNDIEGIGLGLYDLTGVLGVPSHLSALLTMNGLHRYPADPDAPFSPDDSFTTMDVLAHEFAHRWLSYTFVDSAGTTSPALLGRDRQHWGFFFDSDSSFMEGCDWTAVSPDSFVTTGVSHTFGALDQYLMGVRARSEMESLLVVNDPVDLQPPGIYIPTSIPALGVSCDGRATRWTVDDIERVHGPRVPAATLGPDTVHVAFALLVPRGSSATPADLAELGLIRARFPGTIAAATLGRMIVDTRSVPRAAPIVIAHAPLTDTEDAFAPRAVGARITLGSGARPHAVDPASVTLSWRDDSLAAEQSVAMSLVAADSFAATLPPAPASPRRWYRISASSDSAAAPGWPPQAAGATTATHAFAIGPDGTPPQVQHTPVRAQGRTRLPQSLLARAYDGTGIDSVWAEVRLEGGPTLTAAGVRTGADSFVVALGGGPPEGSRFAYRIVARDRALAANLAYSNAAWDTLLVIDDWIEDFENPSPWFTTNVLYSWRTLWHVAERDSAGGATGGRYAWHSGASDGSPYPPHVDGALYSPLIASVPPGTWLRFDHRLDVEPRDATRAWDGARVEVSVANGPWQVALPVGGYTHTQSGSGQPFASGSPCWSGMRPWSEAAVDLSPYAPGPVRVRFRMSADDFVGGDGWWIDRVRIEFPGGATLETPPIAEAPLMLGAAWPQPATRELHQALHLPRASRVEWTLHDLQGRRVAALDRSMLPAGRHTLTAPLAATLASGLYYARVAVDGAPRGTSRVVVLR